MSETLAVEAQGVAVLKENPDDGPLRVRGVALTENDNTHGASKQRLIWPKEVVRDAAEALKGTKIVNDREHKVPDGGDISDLPKEPPIDTIIGEVTEAHYEPGLGVVYEGEIDDPDVAALVENGRVDVSPFIFHQKGPYDEERGGHPVKKIAKWRDLSVVANGAGSQASIAPAEESVSGDPAPAAGDDPPTQASAMSAAVLSAALDESFDGESDNSGEDDPDQPPEPSREDDDIEAEALASFNHLSYDGTKSGKLDESKIDEDEFKSHYLFPGDSKSDSSFPVVDASGNLRRGNVDSAWSLRGDAPVSKEEIEKVLITLAKKFDDPPQTKEDAEALSAQTVDESAESDTSSEDADIDAADPDMTMEIEDEQEQKVVNKFRALDNPVVVESDVEALANRAEELDLDSYDEPHVVEAEGLSEPEVHEKEEFEALKEKVESVENVLAEALAERTGMKKKTAAALSIDSLFSEFENEDGEFEAEALVQEPETGDAGSGSAEQNQNTTPEIDEEAEREAEALAESVMTVSDWRNVEAEGLSAREYVEEQHGIDTVEVDTESQLRRKMASEGGD